MILNSNSKPEDVQLLLRDEGGVGRDEPLDALIARRGGQRPGVVVVPPEAVLRHALISP